MTKHSTRSKNNNCCLSLAQEAKICFKKRCCKIGEIFHKPCSITISHHPSLRKKHKPVYAVTFFLCVCLFKQSQNRETRFRYGATILSCKGGWGVEKKANISGDNIYSRARHLSCGETTQLFFTEGVGEKECALDR